MRALSVRLLLILLTLSIIVPAVALTAFLLWSDYQRQEHQFEAQLLTNARAVSSAIDGRISQGQGVIQGIAAATPADDSLSALYGRAKAATRDLPGWISVSDAAGQQVINTRAPFGAVLPGKLSAAEVAQFSSEPLHVSDLYTGAVTHELVFSITQPIRVGGKLYVLSYVVSPRTLDPVLQAQHLPTGWAVGVNDRPGHVLTRWPDAEAFRGRTATSSFRAGVAGRAEGVIRTRTLRGEPATVAFSRSPVTGWTTGMAVPRDLLLMRALRPLITLGASSLLLLAAGILVAVLLGERLTRAYRLAMSRADALGRGQHPQPGAPVVAEDELLFQAMERAARRLDERTAQNEQAREHQRLLLNELNHRVKNTLSTVQSIALQTARQTGAPDAFVTAFEGRLLSLSKTHSALMNEDWEGAALREVLESELLHYGEGRIALEGPAVMLPPRAALAIGLVAHELATNASKYGALSTPVGVVAVDWSLDETATPPWLRLAWTERGGPPVQPPTRRGFGSRLIERSLTGELAGKLSTTYAADGFCLIATVELRSGGPKYVTSLI